MDRSKFSARIAVVLLLFWATGGQWLVLQSIAWSGMIIDYSKTDHLCGAVSKTFDGDHPCRLCLFIQKQKVGDEDKPKNPIAKAVKAELFGVVFAQLPVTSPVIGKVSLKFFVFRNWEQNPLSPPPRIA